MSQETVTYLTNIIIGVILAGSLTYHWNRQGRSASMGYWVLSAWVMTVADILFAIRPELPAWMGRTVPTILVTLGQATLYLGAETSAERPLRARLMGAIVLLHCAILIGFYLSGQVSNWRSVVNGCFWAGLAFASAWQLRQAPAAFWQPLLAPANAFLAHGLFHSLRLGSGILFQLQGWSEASSWLQAIGDFEVSFFMVALFVSLLVAHLQLRNAELQHALEEVKTLSGLLPMCAWCKKIRDDDGYWQRVEDYFGAHSQIKFTHGICADCYSQQVPQCASVPKKP